MYAIALVAALLTSAAGCSAQNRGLPKSETRLMLDTVCTITVYGAGDNSIITEAFDLCAKLEALLSRTIEGSDVNRVNSACGAAVEVDPLTAQVINAGLYYGDLSGGMFDITIGRLIRLWDFGGAPSVPPGAKLVEAISSIDYKKVSLADNTVQLGDPEALLELGGLAKGFVAEQLALFVMESGARGVIVDLGGDLCFKGAKEDGSPWRIGVRDPDGGKNDLIAVIDTDEASAATSGVYERRFEHDGISYHHILDPGTGMPAESDIVSATVLASNAMDADALSTVALLLGSAKAAGALEKSPAFIGALLVLGTGELITLGNVNVSSASAA